jgi:exodeoxyribonuclease-3
VLVSGSIRDRVKEARIHADVLGSDHCPVSIRVDL